MPKRTIVRSQELPTPYLAYGDDLSPFAEVGEIDRHPHLTLEELADFCDLNALERGNHACVGLHRLLAALLHQMEGREQATRIIQAIAEYGGLDGMNGVGGEPDAFGDFHIAKHWESWSLPL